MVSGTVEGRGSEFDRIEVESVEFVEYVRRRRATVLVCCGMAVGLSLAVSLLLPKQYTATASILIGAPAGVDPRGATSVSQVYLESLKTFENIALSDSLFRGALEHLGIREQYPGRTIEGLKRSVLRVSKPVNTKVIEISATLGDPQKAQALAQYIAEKTVEESRSLNSQFSEDVAKEAQALSDQAAARLKAARTASEQAAQAPAVEGLSAELQSARELKLHVDEDLGKAQADLADLNARHSGDAGAVQARIANLEGQSRTLSQTIAATGTQVAMRTQRRAAVDEELEDSRTAFETASTKLADVRASAAFRGERLDVFDPGIVPQRPTSPNIPLNVLAALLFSLVSSLGFLIFRFGYERARRARADRPWSLR